ncbi:MAG: radical SAM protein [Thermoplasmatales archaeon]|nr:radical SAM protein [Thermoplasmatales archaeon]
MLRITSIKSLPYNGDVYDFEVKTKSAPYSNFMHGFGIFSHNCSFNCLYCQNWHYRNLLKNLSPVMSPETLAGMVDENTRCVCFFGGDPTPQIIHALKTSELVVEKNDNVRICWETNGSMNKNMAKRMAAISKKSGGTIKFDLKAWDEKLNIALCGVTNRQTIENFRFLGEYNKNAGYHLLTASTLLVPGYIDKKEVESISKFISSIDNKIPYCLLGFYPHFYMDDMPLTSKKQAYECLEIAEKHLKNVRIGNLHLLR